MNDGAGRVPGGLTLTRLLYTDPPSWVSVGDQYIDLGETWAATLNTVYYLTAVIIGSLSSSEHNGNIY